MNSESLGKAWEAFNESGVKGQSEDKIQSVIAAGTSKLVAGINKRLIRDMLITGIASVISAIGIIFFYLVYDPATHSHIDLGKLVPVQLLGFVIFGILFLMGWLEFKLVNQKFTPETVKSFLGVIHVKIENYSKVFIAVIVSVLAVTFYLEASYFIQGELLGILISILLTGVSYMVIRKYYQMNYDPYLNDLRTMQKGLEN